MDARILRVEVSALRREPRGDGRHQRAPLRVVFEVEPLARATALVQDVAAAARLRRGARTAIEQSPAAVRDASASCALPRARGRRAVLPFFAAIGWPGANASLPMTARAAREHTAAPVEHRAALGIDRCAARRRTSARVRPAHAARVGWRAGPAIQCSAAPVPDIAASGALASTCCQCATALIEHVTARRTHRRPFRRQRREQRRYGNRPPRWRHRARSRARSRDRCDYNSRRRERSRRRKATHGTV